MLIRVVILVDLLEQIDDKQLKFKLQSHKHDHTMVFTSELRMLLTGESRCGVSCSCWLCRRVGVNQIGLICCHRVSINLLEHVHNGVFRQHESVVVTIVVIDGNECGVYCLLDEHPNLSVLRVGHSEMIRLGRSG